MKLFGLLLDHVIAVAKTFSKKFGQYLKELKLYPVFFCIFVLFAAGMKLGASEVLIYKTYHTAIEHTMRSRWHSMTQTYY